MAGHMYMLLCSDASYYTGSTVALESRVQDHMDGNGARYTKNRLPVLLVYSEEYSSIKEAYYREKQIQNWSRRKKQALVEDRLDDLSDAAQCQNKTHYRNFKDQKKDQ